MFKSLRTNTNRMTNEEHGVRNGVGIDHAHDSAVLRPCFPLLSFFFSLISLKKPLNDEFPPFPQPPSPLFIGNEGIWDYGSSPKRADA